MLILSSQKRFFKRIAAQFGAWVDTSKEGSPAALRHSEEIQIEANRKKVSDIKEKYKGGDYEVLGDLDKGFTVKKLYTIPHPFGGNPKDELDAVKNENDKHVVAKMQRVMRGSW